MTSSTSPSTFRSQTLSNAVTAFSIQRVKPRYRRVLQYGEVPSRQSSSEQYKNSIKTVNNIPGRARLLISIRDAQGNGENFRELTTKVSSRNRTLVKIRTIGLALLYSTGVENDPLPELPEISTDSSRDSALRRKPSESAPQAYAAYLMDKMTLI